MKPSLSKRLLWSRAGLLGLVSAVSCASVPSGDGSSGTGARYPRRGPGCELAIYHTPVPGVPAWDDLGVAEANCHISSTTGECMRMLKAEACRLGGDIIYNVPRKPYRPRDQVMQYRGQVAHTRVGAPKKEEDPNLPPPAPAEEASGPVVPLPSGGALDTNASPSSANPTDAGAPTSPETPHPGTK